MTEIHEMYKKARELGVTNRAIAARAMIDTKTLDNVLKGQRRPHAITIRALEESLSYFSSKSSHGNNQEVSQ